MGNNAPILDLDALVPERPLIRIRTEDHPGGKLYGLRTKPELGILDMRRVFRIAEEGERLMKSLGKNNDISKLTDENAVRLEEILDEMLGIAFADNAYPGLRSALMLEQKVALMQAFSESSLMVGQTAGTETATQSTGAKS